VALGLGGAVRFTGWRNDVPAFLEAADAVFVASLSEARSRIVPEAFAAERPVIATRVGGLPEIVAHGRTGWLVDPGDDVGAARLLRYIATEPEEVARVTRLARRFAEAGLRLDGKMIDTLMAYCTAMTRARTRREGDRERLSLIAGLGYRSRRVTPPLP
jgi:glycosyltransferase involved in cell wall biosynthesis